jgi:nitroreductase
VGSLFEAARWAPSSRNGQPWSFLVADRHRAPEQFAQALCFLFEGNQVWVQHAPLLLFALTNTRRTDGRDHYQAQYDLGLAVAGLVAQATALGLNVRQMTGFDPAGVQQFYQVPADHEAISAIAIGYPGAIDDLPLDMQEYHRAPRVRKALDEFVFAGQFGQSYPLLPGTEE